MIKSARNNNKNKVNKSVQFPIQVHQPKPKPATNVQHLFSVVPLLGTKLSYVKVGINEELDRRALVDTGAFANVISLEFYKVLLTPN